MNCRAKVETKAPDLDDIMSSQGCTMICLCVMNAHEEASSFTALGEMYLPTSLRTQTGGKTHRGGIKQIQVQLTPSPILNIPLTVREL